MTKNINKLAQLKEREAAKVLRTIKLETFQDRIISFKVAKTSGLSESELHTQLESITKDFLPNDRWMRGLLHYITSHDVKNLMPDLLGPRIKFRFDSNGNKVGLDLELDPYTELVDIEAVWQTTKNVLRTIKDTPLRTQPYHNLKRDSDIFNLRQTTKMSNKAIAKWADEHGYSGITPEYVSAIVKRYKDRLDTITP